MDMGFFCIIFMILKQKYAWRRYKQTANFGGKIGGFMKTRFVKLSNDIYIYIIIFL